MGKIARIPISNVLLGGDYTGRICVGPDQESINVLLDTGSSALAIDGKKYKLNTAGGDQSTLLAQTGAYDDENTWTGAVIKTKVSIGEGATSIGLAEANVAIAYISSPDMFRNADGILGLAYATLDDAYLMAEDTSGHQYSAVQVRTGVENQLKPYLTQLAEAGVVSDKIAFLTHRSFTHVGGGTPAGGDADDPLNQGWMILGGGEESTDLYTGAFTTVKVLSDEWYSTNLKSVTVGKGSPVAARSQGPKDTPSNSYVDSGCQTLCFGPQMLNAIISKFTPAQQKHLNQSILGGDVVPTADLDLASWPTLTFVLEGLDGDVSLEVAPTNYWQVNTQDVGMAVAAISKGTPGLTTLGLPLLNGYFTIFDGEADNGNGVIQFAAKK